MTRERSTARNKGAILIAFSLGVATLQTAGIAQTAPFEVASVKVHQGGGGTTREIGPDTMRYLNITLGEFINMAYSGKRYQIAGPDWVVNTASSDRYDIVAKAAQRATPAQIRQMLGPLLAERFQLRFHRETRELTVYALTVLKSGPRFKEGDGGESSVYPDGKGGISFKNYPMEALAGLLSNMPAVGRAVLDRTGLTGRYTFTANLLDSPPASSPSEAKAAIGANQDPVSSPVLSNLQDQLGLKLDTVKAPIEMIVIDHVEKTPTKD